jgi:hypothetical protein
MKTAPVKLDMNIIIWIACILVVLFLVGRLGLKIKPKPFLPYRSRTPAMETVPLPAGLPVPVERFYRQIYGNELPVITSAVITGRVTMRPNLKGPTFPARFRFVHLAGMDYRHYFEMCFFGLPLIKGNEHYLDGKSRLELPFGMTDEGPKVDQAANLGLWAESMWLPAIMVTDRRVIWEPVDNDSAVLVVPFADQKQHFIARFDPATGLLHMLESMRYQKSTSAQKMLWLNENLEYRTIAGYTFGAVGSATWINEGTPWAIFTAEDIVYNVDVNDYLRTTGP